MTAAVGEVVGEIVVALLMSSPAPQTVPAHWHDDEGQARRTLVHQVVTERDSVAAECYLSPHDVLVIDQYYGERTRPAPFGLARKLERTARLPADWERRVEPLPVLVDRQLAALPRGMRRGLLDGYTVIYRPETETIVDAVAMFRLH